MTTPALEAARRVLNGQKNGWPGAASDVATIATAVIEQAAEIERLRAMVPTCERGPRGSDLLDTLKDFYNFYFVPERDGWGRDIPCVAGCDCTACKVRNLITPAPEQPKPAAKRCPHDGGTCHHGCANGECYREANGMALSTPHKGYPKPAGEWKQCGRCEKMEAKP